MVVVTPVGHGAKRCTRRKYLRRLKQRHKCHETTVRSSIDTHTTGIYIMFTRQPLNAVDIVLKLRRSHLPVNRGAPVPPISLATPVIHIEYVITPSGQGV